MTQLDGSILWHLYPLGFTGAPIRPVAGEPLGVVHRLPRIEQWLDHVVDLGLDGLLLGPIFASTTHGYDTVDHFRIDPRLGDENDFDHLVEAGDERGLAIVLDGVFNHVGRDHPAFRAVEAEGPGASTADLFAVRWEGWAPGDPVPVDVFEGHDGLVELNHGSRAARELTVAVMRHWLDRGAAGWRLDAAYSVPSAFWSDVIASVRTDHPDAWFLGELIHGDAAGVVRSTGMDTVTQYELWQGIWHSIADRNFFELGHALERHDALLETFVPQTFVGNHDVTRIASAVGAEFVPHALAVLFCVAGTPSVYAGDEYGMQAVKEDRVGGDDAIRPQFPSPPARASLDETERAILDVHRDLIALRRERPWLIRAHSDVVEVRNRSLVLRTGAGAGSVVVALSVEDDAVSLPAGGASTVLAGCARVANGRVDLPPKGWTVLA